MIYNIVGLTEDEIDADFHVFNYIFGAGGISSMLYKTLRCDHSLCYAVRSLYLKYDGLLVIEVSLDKENVNLAQKLIREALKDFVKGNFPDSSLEDAKKSLLHSLQMTCDSNVSLLNNYEFHQFASLPLISEREEMIRKVTKEDVIKCAKSLRENTIYVQDSEANNERN